jgi:FlaA1/EpsC-like NDP-sugar epimerase
VAGVYRRAWRYATARDLALIAAASSVATLAAFGIVVATRDLRDFPPEVFLLYGVTAALLAVASRWLVRFVPEAGRGENDTRRRVLVVGAGRDGRGLARDLRRDDDAVVVGFLDDNPRLQRRRVQGVPVLGTTDEAEAVLRSSGADELIPSHPDTQAVTE